MERSGGKADRRRGTVERMCQVGFALRKLKSLWCLMGVICFFSVVCVDEFVKVIEKEGWGRLYGGLTPSIVGTAASQVC